MSEINGKIPSKLVRLRSRNITYNEPPPLPLITLPPDDEWEELNTPTRTGFDYTLPYLDQLEEEPGSIENINRETGVDDAKICRLLSEYMTQNEIFQTQRHGFGIDTRLVYKRNKALEGVPGIRHVGNLGSEEDFRLSSFFESGNLERGYRVIGRHYATRDELHGAATRSTSSANSTPPFAFFVKVDMEYDLYCDTDINTRGHIQWYFFRAEVPAALLMRKTSLKVRFNIRNMAKKSSLYNEGMLPAVYVDGSTQHNLRGWHHAGTNVCYYKNSDTFRNPKTGKVQSYYTLSFVYEFQSEEATDRMAVYFAHCYPYTYTRLQHFIMSLQKDPERGKTFKRRVLCKTIAGNNCDLLTITDFSQEDDLDHDDSKKRTGIVLTARVHPGESNSSFVMHGILNFLTGSSREAQYLRHHFIFKIVPMLNPDGVIHGNYRCSLAGSDLNRRWVNPSADLHPTIHATKNMILSMRKSRPISLYCDIHGHSRKKNIFLYGCRPFEINCRSEATQLRLFPHILTKMSDATRGGFYSFPDCTFTVNTSKKGTGRVVVWAEAEVLHSFTLEASFYGVGPNKSRSANRARSSITTTTGNSNNHSEHGHVLLVPSEHFTPLDLHSAGLKFCHALLPFTQMLNLQRDTPKVSSTKSETVKRITTTNETCARLPVPANAKQITMDNTCLVRDSVPETADNKIRLVPLQDQAVVTSRNGNGDVFSQRPSEFLCKYPALQNSDNPMVQSTFVNAVNLPFFHSDATSEFDPYIDDESSRYLSLYDPDNLFMEIEASLPSNFQDQDEEDGSVGSESDYSGDNMEEEEPQRQEPLVHNSVLHSEGPSKKENISSFAPKTHPLRLTRQLSEPKIQTPATMKTINAPDMTISSTREPPAKLLPMTSSTVSRPRTALAPLRVGLPSSHNPPWDRNREIAVMHQHAVQRRSKARRGSQRVADEVCGIHTDKHELIY